jgi:hypothetical protein
MTFTELEAAVNARCPPPDDVRPLVRALWLDATGDWAGAHDLTQGVESPDGAWVHAYLHRKEGDADNARYWYRRAGRPEARGAIEDEWRAIARALLEDHR